MFNHKLHIFLYNIKAKKIKINNIKVYVDKLTYINYKLLTLNLIKNIFKINFIKYIILLNIKNYNIFLHISNYLGLTFNFYSKYSLKLNKKSKNIEIFKKMLESIYLKFQLLENNPLGLHLVNLNFNIKWFIKNISKKLLINNFKIFKNFKYNGCRKKKLK